MLKSKLILDSRSVMRAGVACLVVFLAGFIAGCPGVEVPPPADPCAGVTCAVGESCVNGNCVPDAPADPCVGVTCAVGESCVNGSCVPDAPAGVSFSADIQPIFDTSCIACHITGGIAASTGLFLTSGDSHSLLVNQPSDRDPDILLVVPGNSAASALFQKVSMADPDPIGGSRMPLGGTPLSANDLALIRDWIDQGAENN